MPYEEYLDFIERLRKPMVYALDEGASQPTDLSLDDFFQHICANFDPEDEEGVGEALESADKFVVVVAPPGGARQR